MNYLRWLFGILLLANLSLFVWKSGDEIKVARNHEPAATVPGIPGLTLLSEAPVPEQPAAVTPPPASPQPAPESTPAPPVVEKPATEQPIDVAKNDVPAQSTPTPPEQPAEVPEAPPVVATVTAPKEDPFCVRLGPFQDEKPARDAIADLAASQIFATLLTEGEARPSRYIVYLKPAKSRQAALETLRELRAKKIDSFVFSSGELRNGVSLGIFSQQASARRLQQKMKREGYNALMVTRKGETQRFWISLGPKNTQRLSNELHAALQERYQEADYQREACP